MRNLPGSELQRSCHCGTRISVDTRKHTDRQNLLWAACLCTRTDAIKLRISLPSFSLLSWSQWHIISQLMSNVDLFLLSSFFTPSMLLCLIHGNWALECAEVRLTDSLGWPCLPCIALFSSASLSTEEEEDVFNILVAVTHVIIITLFI